MLKIKLPVCFFTLLYAFGLNPLWVIAQNAYSTYKSMTTNDARYYPLENGVVMHINCQDGTKLIGQMADAVATMNNYSANYHMKAYKDKQIIKEAGVIYFRKPKFFRVEVTSGPKKGSLAILESDGKVHGHLGGALKYFHAAVPPDSSFVRAINDFPMVGSDFYSLVDYLKNMLKQGDLSLQTNKPVFTQQTQSLNYVLDMFKPGDKNSNKSLLLKRIFIDPRTYLPVFWQDYVGGSLWSESDWYNVRNNLNLSDNLFKI